MAGAFVSLTVSEWINPHYIGRGRGQLASISSLKQTATRTPSNLTDRETSRTNWRMKDVRCKLANLAAVCLDKTD